MSQRKQLIGGNWCDALSGGTWDLLNPATEECIDEIPFGGREDCQAAIDAAEEAFTTWKKTTPYERAAILLKAVSLIKSRIDELASITTEESGKPFVQAKGEWYAGIALLEWFAEEGKRSYGRVIPSREPQKRLQVIMQPMGVIGVITAWNFPVYNTSRSWAAALAAGCTVVARPSEYTPLSAMALAECLVDAGLPNGVLNVVNGDPEAMGQLLLESPVVRKISFTGSVRVGKILMDGASKTVTKLALELGGNAPVLILPDAEIDDVVLQSVTSKFRNCGQVCVSPQRFYIPSNRIDEFSDKASSHIEKIRLGSGLDPDTDMGPLINAIQRDRISSMVDTARKEGASVVMGGKRPEAHEKGYFYEPTLVRDLNHDSTFVTNELFGPVMPLLSFDDLEEAVHHANSTDYGLAAYVFTRDLKAATYAQEALEFGMIGINTFSPQCIEGPFGGFKQSGIGRECGIEGLKEYQEEKLVGTVL